MQKKQITTLLESLAPGELSAPDRELIEAAKEATGRSYAPYSHFHVGAALRLDSGRIVTGSNQENAAFGAGTCAERSACFYAHANWPDDPIRKIAVAARNMDARHATEGNPFQAEPISPCGVCRQALLEFEHLYGPIEVLLYGDREIYRLPSVASLLPLCFTEF